MVERADLPRVLTLLWGREEPGRRGPKPRHGIRDIGTAGIQVADREGLGAVSMGRVAKELGLTTMALYRYVDAKDDLLLAMTDTAYGTPPARRRSTTGWRTQLEAWANANRDALGRHPWIVQIPIDGPPLGPNTLAWMERGLLALAATPLTEQEKLSSLLLIEVYVRGQTLLNVQFSADGESEAAANERYVRRLIELIDEDEFPAITKALRSGSLQDEGDFASDEFRFGLQVVLDGIAALIERRSGASRRRGQPG